MLSEISSKVKKNHHARIKEILTVVDLKEKYIIKDFGNIVTFREQIKSLMSDSRGYTLLDSVCIPLNGNVQTYPTVKVSGDFIVVLIKVRYLNPHTKEDFRENYILLYEPSEDLAKKIGSVIGC